MNKPYAYQRVIPGQRRFKVAFDFLSCKIISYLTC